VDIGNSYKYLGTIIDNKLSWSLNTNSIFSKCQQRLYFLCLLRSFGIDNTILNLFYSSVIQSVVSFNIIVWWSSAGKCQQGTLNRIRNKAIKLFGSDVPHLDELYVQNVIKKVNSILNDQSHILHPQYLTMRSHRIQDVSVLYRIGPWTDSVVGMDVSDPCKCRFGPRMFRCYHFGPPVNNEL